MDKDGSFRLGVEISLEYTSILSTILIIFEKIKYIYKLLHDNSDIKKLIKEIILKLDDTTKKCKTSLIIGLTKNEVSESNLKKANDIIELIKKNILLEYNKIELYSSFDGKKYNYDLLNSFNKLCLENINTKDIISIIGGVEIYNKMYIINEIKNNINIFSNYFI